MRPLLLFAYLAGLLGLSTSVAWAQTGTITGTVFEDLNYGGGAGRSRATANAVQTGSAVAVGSAATVELYTSAGAYVRSTTTSTAAATLGQYTFGTLAAGNYLVRVVNSTVRSTRPGTVAGLLPVQTFRTQGGNGTADLNRVGGEAPELVDAGAYTPGSTAATFTFNSQATSGDNAIFLDNLTLNNSGTLANNSFETPSQGTGSNAYTYRPTGATWAFSGNSGITYANTANNNSAWNAPTAPNGAQVAFVQSINADPGSLQQTISLVPGTTYTLTLQAAQRNNGGRAQVVQGTTTINGVTTALTFTSTLGTVSNGNIAPTVAQGFVAYTATFTVPAPSNVLATFTAQSLAPVTLAAAASAVTGVDFGFNFSTIVNTNESGQGSLRQFILNSNALTNAGLAQVGQLAGREVSIFMIPDGNAHAGQRSGLVSGLTGTVGAARALIEINSPALPAITDARTRIDGTVQTTYIGDTNVGQLGTGGTVGVKAVTLNKINRPEIELSVDNSLAYGLDLEGDSLGVRGIALHGGVLRAGQTTTATNLQIISNLIGITALSVADPGNTIYNTGYGIHVTGASYGVVRNNLIGYTSNSGLNYSGGANTTGLSVTRNEFLQSGYRNAGGDGISVGDNGIAGPIAILFNLITTSNSDGLQFEIGQIATGGINVVRNNTFFDNGNGSSSTVRTQREGAAILYLQRAGTSTGTNADSISFNIINQTQASGIVVGYGQRNTIITRNSTFGNGTSRNSTTGGNLGIDIITNPAYFVNSTSTVGATDYGNGDGVTPNTGSLNTAFGSGGMNYPVFTLTRFNTSNNITVAGYVGSAPGQTAFKGATIDIYFANNLDGNNNGAVVSGDGTNVAHGEGQTYLTTLTADANGNFNTTITAPAGVVFSTSGQILTATAYLSGSGTSEFGPNSALEAVVVSGYVYEDANYGGGAGRSRATLGSGAVGRPGAAVEIYDATNALVGSATTDSNGAYSFTVPSGTYKVRTVVPSVTSARPNGLTASPAPVAVQTYVRGDVNRVGGEQPSATADDAAAPAISVTLSFVGLNPSGLDNTAFIDQVELVDINGNVVATTPGNASFESPNLGSNFSYSPTGASWTFGNGTGISGNGSAFGSNTTSGTQVGFVQGDGSTLQQAIQLPAGTYSVRFITAQRVAGGRVNNQTISVQINGAEVGRITPSTGNFVSFRTNEFGVKGGAQSSTPGLSQTTVVVNTASVTDVDFGYNFDTVVNTNNAGQGSLRQFIANSNALGGEAALAPVHTGSTGTTTPLATGLETSIFMVSNGTAVAGLRAGLPSGFATTTGTSTAATFTPTSALPAITGPNTALDGNTQTRTTGATNAVVTTAAAQSTGPEVVLNLNGLTGLAFSGANEQVTGLGITGSAAASSGILVNSTATGLTINNNTLYGNGANVSLLGSASGTTVASNVIRSSTRTGAGGIVAQGGTSGNTFSQNIFDANTGLAIDLTNGTTTNGDGVTLNDLNDADTGANGLANFPVLTSPGVSSSILTVRGYARPGALVEVYIASVDPTNFGEGQSYLGSFTQGTAVGTVGAVTTGAAATYGPATINGLSQGTDNTNTFVASLPLSSFTAAQRTALLSGTAILTSTATLNGNTSEFSGNVLLPVADVTVSITGPTTLSAGKATGTYTATFTNEGGGTATNVARVITLPTGASLTTAQQNAILAAYPGATFTPTGTTAVTTIDFGAVASLALNAASSVSFAFTAPNALATNYTLTATTTADSQGVNTAPDQTTLALSTVASADVMAAISASATATTGTFTVTFSNILAQTAAGVVRTVQLPTGLTGVAVSGDAGSYSATTGLVTYTTSPTTIAAGSALNSTITFPLTSGAIPVTAVASISTTTDEAGLTANNTASATMTTVLDLATTLSGPATTIAGSPTMLYVTTTNGGPNAAPTSVQSLQLVAGLSNVFLTNGGVYNSATSTQALVVNGVSYSVPAGGVIFPLTGLATGQTITNSVSFNAPSAVFAPVATVAAAGAAAVVETSTTNNTAYLNAAAGSTNMAVTGATTNVANEATTIVATVGTTTTPATIVSPGSTITYTVTATNNGPSATTDVVQKVQLLPGLTASTLTVGTATGTTVGGNIQYVTTSGTSTYSPATGVLTYYTLTNQASGATTTYDKLTVTAPTALGNGAQLLATASVTTALSDPVPADNVASVTVKVRTLADLTTSVSGPAAPVAGLPATYVVQFANNGPGDAITVAETAQLPAGLASVVVTDASGSVVSGAYNSTTGLVTFLTQANVAAGTSLAYTIVLTAPYQNFPVSSTIASPSAESSLTNNSASLNTNTSTNADVAVSISGPVTAVVGNPITYFVTTTNNGPTVASGIVASVQLPAGLSNVVAGPTTTNSASYNSTSGLLTFATTATLPMGGSAVNYVTFTMPNPASGLISGLASVSTSSLDQLTGNNTAGLTTSIAPTTTDVADLVTSIPLTTPSGTPTSVPAGTLLTYTANYRNAGPNPALNVMPTVSLPTGLAATSLQVGGATGTLANGVITFNTGSATGATYNVATGLLALPIIASQAVSATLATSYTITFPAPVGSGQLVVISAVGSSTTDNGPGANRANSSITINTSYDVVTALTGPLTALPGTLNNYTVTTLNNGPSTASTATTQTVNLPTGLTTSTLLVGGQAGTLSGTTITFPNAATYSTSSGLLTLPSVANLPAGAANEVVNSFALVMPASGSLTLTATVASANESDKTNDQATFTTNPANLAPVAQNVWNTLQTARGNTANLAAATGLAISPLVATDADGISTYTVLTLPSSTQGVLYYNGSAVKAGDPVAARGLTFAPTAATQTTPAFVGNATFTYSATDNANATNSTIANAVSNVALYTIPVAQDQSSVYSVYNDSKGGTTANKYVTGDVLAQITDANTATYNSAGLLYNATTGVLQSGAANGLPLTGTNATLVSGTLPAGVSLDPATGRIYVSNAAQMVNNTTARTYTVSVQTTDINGGTNVVPVSFTIGALPLPVVLTAFTAQAVANRDALLNWATASEQHNDHFDIERSLDGRTFATIGSLAGHGTTAAASTYSLTDAGVARLASGPVYYRLKQVDTDGTATFSPLRAVSFTQDLAPVSLRVFPNPVATLTYLDLSQLPAAATVQAQLLDATGRTSLRWSLAAGLPQPLDLTSLASGAYLLLLTGTQPDGSALHQTLRITKE